METRSRAWLFRKARQLGEGGLRRLSMYLWRVDYATTMLSFPSSPTIRGAPQVELACDI